MTGKTKKVFSRGTMGLGVAMLVGAFPGAVVFAQITYQTIALTDDDAHGLTDAEYDTFGSPMLNNVGEVAYIGVFTGTGVNTSNDGGLWAGGEGAIALIAREGVDAVGASTGQKFSASIAPLLNDSGEVAFVDVLTGTGVTTANDRGIWSNTGGTLALIAREGSSAPGTSEDYDSLFDSNLVFNPQGEVAFFGTVTGGSNTRGIWSDVGGTLTLFIREGDDAPGTSEDFTSFGAPVINEEGEIAFQANLTGASNEKGIWSDIGGSLSLVARKGDDAPGTALDFVSFSDPVINDAGKTLFEAEVTGNIRGIWTDVGGTISLVAVNGDDAEGLTGIDYGNLSGSTLNGEGQVAFRGFVMTDTVTVTTSDDTALWSEGSGTLELIAREGSTAPETGGELFDALDIASTTRGPFLNNVGLVAFQGKLVHDGDVDGNNDVGIWATDANGNLQLIVREGDNFDFDDDVGTTDIISGSDGIDMTPITTSGGEEGRYDPINDECQLAFRLKFTDGTMGIFIANLGNATVPADIDDDGDVDSVDFGVFSSCYNGAGNPPRTLGCTAQDAMDLDFDDDGDVDGVDFGVFSSCSNGAGNPPRTAGCPHL